MSFWSYSKLVRKRYKKNKYIQKRSLTILNFFKVASGDNSVFELGHSSILEDIIEYVLDINSKYIKSVKNANEKSGIDAINDYFTKEIKQAYDDGDKEKLSALQNEYEKEIAFVVKEKESLHSDETFFQKKVDPVRNFSFYGSESRNLFSERFINVLIKNLNIDNFDSILFNLEIQVEKPGSTNAEKGHISPGKFPANFDGNSLYLGRIFVRVNRNRINFSDTLDTITHELKHIMQIAGSLTLSSLDEAKIPFGQPSGFKTYNREKRYFDSEKDNVTREMLERNDGLSKEFIDKIMLSKDKRNEDLEKTYKEYEERNKGRRGFAPGSRVKKDSAPLVIDTDQFYIAIEPFGSLGVKKKGDQRTQDDPFESYFEDYNINKDIEEVKKFLLGSGAKIEGGTNIEGAQHNIIPAEFYTNLSGKIVSFRKDIYKMISLSREISKMEPDVTTRKIMFLSSLYKMATHEKVELIDVKKYISNLPYMDHLDDPFASRSGIGGSVRSINTHITSAISQYAADIIKSKMLNFDDFKSRLNIITNERLRSQVWNSFSKQTENLSKKELSKILGAARSDAGEIINILEGGELSERSFFKYFDSNKGES